MQVTSHHNAAAMRPSVAVQAIYQMILQRMRVFLWGMPGVGKSSIVQQVSDMIFASHYPDYAINDRGECVVVATGKVCRRPWLIDLRAVLLESVDLRGLPVIENGKCRWVPPSFLPLAGTVDGPGIIFADELGHGFQSVQAAFLQGILDHRIGEAEIDPSWVWVAASNRMSDKAGVGKMLSPLISRFHSHIEIEPNVDDFVTWGMANGLRADILSWVKFAGMGALMTFDPSDPSQREFACPRTIAFASQIANLPVDEPTMTQLLLGCVGSVAIDYMGHRKLAAELNSAVDILANPSVFNQQARSDVKFAISFAVGNYMIHNDTTKEQNHNFGKFLDVLDMEFAAMLGRMVLTKRRTLIDEVPSIAEHLMATSANRMAA